MFGKIKNWIILFIRYFLVMSESDEESPEERMARIIGPRAEYDESNRRKELRKRLSRKAVRYRRWLMQVFFNSK